MPGQCHDLSQTGIAFYWPQKPTFKSVVLALTDGTTTMRLLAGVRHFREGYWNRKRQFLVGCEFQCRVRYPQQATSHSETDILADAGD